MDAKIIERSNAWKDAVARECTSRFPYKNVGDLSVFEQLQLLFNDEVCDKDGSAMFRWLKREYFLQVPIAGNDIYHLEAVVADAFQLGNALFKLLPSCWVNAVNLGRLDKSKFDFAGRNETAVFQIWRNINVSIIEMQVKTTALEHEVVYWNKDKIFVIDFVSELDEKHAVSGSDTLYMRPRYI